MVKIQKGGNILDSAGGALANVMTLVGRVAFVLLIVILFVLFLNLELIITGLFTPDGSPYLYKGMKDGKDPVVIPQDPSNKNSIPILRSVNQRDGIEFTWSVWLYIKDIKPEGQVKYIFHKGNSGITNNSEHEHVQDGMNFPNNGPGMYIDSGKNALIVVMNTFDNIMEEIRIDNIPMNKWINVMIRCEGKTVDVYINGAIAKRHVLTNVPKQNYGNIYINANGGFNGNLSDLRYFDKSLGLSKIQSIVEKGANLKVGKKDEIETNKPPYLSLRWYLMGTNK